MTTSVPMLQRRMLFFFYYFSPVGRLVTLSIVEDELRNTSITRLCSVVDFGITDYNAKRDLMNINKLLHFVDRLWKKVKQATIRGSVSSYRSSRCSIRTNAV